MPSKTTKNKKKKKIIKKAASKNKPARTSKKNKKVKKTKAVSAKNSSINLKEIKAKLLEYKNELLSEINKDNDSKFDKDIGDEIDEVTQNIEKELTFEISSKGKNLLTEVENALKKIEIGTYGICELCKGTIEPKRLKALPYVRYCIKCQSRQDKVRI